MMNNFTIEENAQGIIVRAQGSTRPGLLTAILKGIAAAQAAIKNEETPLIERAFCVEAEEFPDLIKRYVIQVLTTGAEQHEVYEAVRLTFATDRKVEGVIIGRKVNDVAHALSGLQADGFDIERTIEGPWKATIPLR